MDKPVFCEIGESARCMTAIRWQYMSREARARYLADPPAPHEHGDD